MRILQFGVGNLDSVFFFWKNFANFLQRNQGNFGKFCFFSVISTNLANF